MKRAQALFAGFGIFLGMLATAGSPALAANIEALCSGAQPPAISVTTLETPVSFDTRKSMAGLKRLRIDTASPWPQTYHTGIGGVMTGAISAGHEIAFTRARDKKSGWGCVWFNKINITLRIDPKIYIASELKDDACHFRGVFAHEARHIEVDRALMKKFERQVGDGMRMAFSTPSDYVSGPVPLASIDRTQAEMEAAITQVLQAMFGLMMRERAQRQQALDSLGEYVSIGNGC